MLDLIAFRNPLVATDRNPSGTKLSKLIIYFKIVNSEVIIIEE